MSTTLDEEITDLLAPYSPEIRELTLGLRALVRDVVPDAKEDVDTSAKLIGFTFIPGTYKGLFAAVALQKTYVNLMFSKGVELMALDLSGLLEGTGKKARHIKFHRAEQVANAEVRTLIEAAARLTPRA